ncbi:DUF4255 domain-containing protein [Sphingomonas sp.]|uniref:DUF4255 domain-containing protein n=1 Tax=Sphingomonas sp. TaxID=28214 RepID=UPI002FD89640
MSTAIATATTALRDMLRSRIAQIAPDLADLLVTTRSPNQARSAYGAPQLNLFLFDVSADRTFRTSDRPEAPEGAMPILGVTLHYLLTAYGPDDDDGELICHRVLGAAMSVMHGSPFVDNAQVGALRINRLEMTALEMATLWSSLQMPYQLSAAYAVGVVTIENP